MELVLTSKNFEPLVKQQEDLVCEPSGFLTSEYKNVVNESLNNVSSKSIFGIRQRIKSRNYSRTCVAETTLKLALFLVTILLIY